MWLKHRTLSEYEQKLVNMSVEQFDDYMMANYPDMFKQRRPEEGSKIILPMHYGFAIGPGWSHVLDSLCSKLQIIQDWTGHVCVFDQIKEKYGEARFYYHIERNIEPNNSDHSDNSDETKTICDIISSLVNSHEEYCSYICDELGINVDPNEKVMVGRWCYGSGIEGIRQFATQQWGDAGDSRIKTAEEYIIRKKEEEAIRELFHDLSNNEISELHQTVSEMIQEPQKV